MTKGPRLRGIRPRVVVAYIGLMATGLLVANLVVRQVLISRMDQAVEAALTQEVEELRRLAAGNDPETGEPFGSDVEALFDTYLRRNVPAEGETIYTLVRGEPFATSFAPHASFLTDDEMLRRFASTTSPDRFDIETEAGPARVLAVPVTADGGDTQDPGEEVLGSFVVAFFVADEQADIDHATRLVAVVSLAVLVASSAVAWLLVGRVLRPVAQLTATATAITETDMSARIPVQGQDELARLGLTVNSMLDRIESLVTHQRAFLDDIAHDLRTPLTIVQGHLDMLSDDPAERSATISLVNDELDRMGRYVTDLLVLAKAEQPDFLRLGLVDLGEWAAELAPRAEHFSAGQDIRVDAPRPGHAFAEADADRLTQATLNLIVNAMQHTGEGDQVHIEVWANDGEASIRVSDTGPGIEPELLGDLFERTSRGRRSESARREGTGLGLAIVRAIAEAHGGSVSVASEVGRGATFTIIVPLDRAGHLGPVDPALGHPSVAEDFE